MDANKQRGQGWSSSEMPTALLVTLSAPHLCSPILGCTRRNTCFLVCVQYRGEGGFPQLRYCSSPLPGESPPWGGCHLEKACLEFSEVWELVSPLPAPKQGSEGTDCRHASGGSLPLLPVHLRGFSDWPVPTSRGFRANLGAVISLLR